MRIVIETTRSVTILIREIIEVTSIKENLFLLEENIKIFNHGRNSDIFKTNHEKAMMIQHTLKNYKGNVLGRKKRFFLTILNGSKPC